jgi:hypothetical protein
VRGDERAERVGIMLLVARGRIVDEHHAHG